MNNILVIILIVGGLGSLVLGVYAYSLLRKVRQQERQKQERLQQRREKTSADLSVLLGVLLDEQAAWVELCIRIKVILEHYDFELSRHSDYQVFQTVYLACEGIPTHEAWKELSREERRKHEASFAKLEKEHKESSYQAATKLRQLLSQSA